MFKQPEDVEADASTVTEDKSLPTEKEWKGFRGGGEAPYTCPIPICGRYQTSL